MAFNGNVQETENTYLFRKNVWGDVTEIYDTKGEIVGSYRYDAWGNIISQSGSMAGSNPFRYRGYYYDTETGFYYLQNRYYDPEIRRFINADKLELTPELSQVVGQLNLYAYCNNNPVMNTDPNGENVVSFLVILGINILLGAIDGGITAAMNGQEFGLGAGAGAIAGVISGVLGQTNKILLSILGRGISSFGYNALNEVFQTGRMGTANLGLYSVDALMDMAFSGLYYDYFGTLGNKAIGAIFNETVDEK